MTIYGVLDILDKILSPNTTKFSDYVKWTSDDNSFLRTCYCKKSECLRDRRIPNDCEYVVVCSESIIDEQDLICKLTNTPFAYEQTMTKLQICFASEGEIEDEVEWSYNMGYRFSYVVNLKTETLERAIFEGL